MPIETFFVVICAGMVMGWLARWVMEVVMIETRQGLPNTCCRCGQPAGETWWAAHVDAARSGQGLCAACAAKDEGGGEQAEADDLTLIVGIGETTAALLAAGGIRTFALLAATDAATIEALAPRASPAQVQDWIEQAQDLAREA